VRVEVLQTITIKLEGVIAYLTQCNAEGGS